MRRSENASPRPRVLVVEDDQTDRATVAESLRRAGMLCADVSTLAGALPAARATAPDLVVLDLSMRDGNGKSLIGPLTSLGVPVLVCSGDPLASTSEECLSLGALDYILKPFSPGDLAARAARALRESPKSPFGGSMQAVSVNTSMSTISLSGRSMKLPPKEMKVLQALLDDQGQPVTRDSLREKVWASSEVGLGNVTEHVRRLSGRLKELTGLELITSLRGRGYALSGTVRFDVA